MTRLYHVAPARWRNKRSADPGFAVQEPGPVFLPLSRQRLVVCREGSRRAKVAHGRWPSACLGERRGWLRGQTCAGAGMSLSHLTPAEPVFCPTACVLHLLHIHRIDVIGGFLRDVAAKTLFVHILHRTGCLITLENFKAPAPRVTIKPGILLH